MEKYSFEVGRNICDDSWKKMCWSSSRGLASTTTPARKSYVFTIIWSRQYDSFIRLEIIAFSFKYAKLTETVTQNDKLFIDLLNKVQAGNNNNNVEKLLKAKFNNDPD